MSSLATTDFRHRALYVRELATLVLSAWAGAIVAGFATFVFSGGGVNDQPTEVGSFVLVLALLPILLTLIPGALLQVSAAPDHDFSFHVNLSFFAGVLYCLGWIALVLLATAAAEHVSYVVTALAWCYYLGGPVAIPAALGAAADRLRRAQRGA